MYVDPYLYTHEADRMTLQALQAIPGFSAVLKAFMKVWNEKQDAICNMSTNIRLSEEQLPQYYNMLPPICEKLGIEVPELYLCLDEIPNAYTSGDTKPYIVITSGLIENFPEELIPTVLAHECGHIACHHVLYHTMGKYILSGTLMGLTLATGFDFSLLTAPLNVAFARWIRCSELSADRAAIICDGTSEKFEKMCMYFAGYTKKIGSDINFDAFMKQAVEYRDMISSDKWSQFLEHLMMRKMTHPLVAIRALEAHEWAQSDEYRNCVSYIECTSEEYTGPVPMLDNTHSFVGMEKEEAKQKLLDYGFTDISFNRVIAVTKKAEIGEIVSLTIGDEENFKKGTWFDTDTTVVLNYYEPKREEEIAAEHPDERRLPNSSKYYKGMHFQGVAYEFNNAGFENIIMEPTSDAKGKKEGTALKITVNGEEKFEKGIWTYKKAEIKIVYFSAMA